MSYDVYFKKWKKILTDRINHTSNTGEMISKAMDVDYWRDEIDWKVAKDVINILKNAIERLADNDWKAKSFSFLDLRIYEPENKWGTLETTQLFLTRILWNCYENPKSTIYISK